MGLSIVAPSRSETSFKNAVAPIFLEKCVACHGAEKSKGGFRLDSFAALMKGGESKKASVAPGSPESSRVFQLVTTTDADDRMPQKSDPLSEKEIATIRSWILEGAKFDGAAPDQSLAALVPYSPGAAAPIHYPFPQPVFALAWTEDGKQLASSGYHEALIWNEDGKLTRRVAGLPQRIHGLAFVEHDKKLALAGGTPGKSGEILVCDLGSTEAPRLLARLPDVAVALALNKERTLLAAGGADNSIHVFEMPGGRELFVAQQHADWVAALAFSPSGKQIASASRDRTARVFDAKNGELLETYAEHLQPLFAVAFSSDGKKVFSGGREKRAHAWQVQEAKKSGEFPALEGDILAMIDARDRLIVAGADKAIRVFNANDRKEIKSLAGHHDWIYALAWSEATSRLASGSYDGEIRIWNPENAEAISSFKAAP